MGIVDWRPARFKAGRFSRIGLTFDFFLPLFMLGLL
jgi:hypothetical protein